MNIFILAINLYKNLFGQWTITRIEQIRNKSSICAKTNLYSFQQITCRATSCWLTCCYNYVAKVIDVVYNIHSINQSVCAVNKND